LRPVAALGFIGITLLAFAGLPILFEVLSLPTAWGIVAGLAAGGTLATGLGVIPLLIAARKLPQLGEEA